MMALSTAIQSLLSPVLLLGAAVLYAVFKVVQRLWFHPLAKVPGPWYAAASTFYEFWWDCLKDGKYRFKIEELHKKYGPIIRINPWEVHIDDPSFMDTLFANSRMEKDPFFYDGFSIPISAMGTVSADAHRIRRGAMAQYFSKANVMKLEPRVLARVQQLCERIQEFSAQRRVIDISNAYRCLATDIVTDYCVPNTRNHLAHPDFNRAFNLVVRDTAGIINWNRHLPFVMPLVKATPRNLAKYLDKDGSIVAVLDNQADFQNQARAVYNGVKTKDTEIVINAILKHPSLPASEKSFQRIFEETVTVISAGTETSGSTLAVMTYHICSNPNVYQALKTELSEAASRAGISTSGYLNSKVVEPLPYLQAVMKEGLRIASPVSGRLPRRNPEATMAYTTPTGETYVLPPGFVASMTPSDIHSNPSVFSDPLVFNPRRWIDGTPEEIAHREKHLIPFGKGVRQCVGLELAKQEILLVTANLFWKFDLELYETTYRDVEVKHDYFAPFAERESLGVRVKVRE